MAIGGIVAAVVFAACDSGEADTAPADTEAVAVQGAAEEPIEDPSREDQAADLAAAQARELAAEICASALEEEYTLDARRVVSEAIREADTTLREGELRTLVNDQCHREIQALGSEGQVRSDISEARDAYELPEGIEFVFDEGAQQFEGMVRSRVRDANMVFKKQLGVEVEEATILVFADIDGLRTAATTLLDEPIEHLNIHEGVSAQAWAGLVGLYVGGSGAPSPHVVAHELFHVLQFQLMYPGGGLLPLAPPNWLSEGSADYVAALVRAELSGLPDLEAHIERESCRGANASLSELEEPPGRTPRVLDYCLGRAAAMLLASAAGEEALVEFWALRGQGEPWQVAFRNAFGMSVDEFYAEFDAWNQ